MSETQVNLRPVGVVGLFDSPDALIRAARRFRDARPPHWDCHTPFPVHGLDDAMGLRASPMPFITIGMAFVGLAAAIALTGWLSVVQYPIRIGGKPLFSWQAFVPIYFELFVLFATVSTMAAIIGLCRLGRWHSPLHDTDVMKEITRDRFALAVRTGDDEMPDGEARKLLDQAGCRDVRTLVEEE